MAVTLQGDKDRIDQVLAAIRRQAGIFDGQHRRLGPRRSRSRLKTFTVFAWTSTSRTSPYDLVVPLRPANDQISRHEAKAIWNKIAEGPLKGDDLAKFMTHLDDDD